MRTILMIRLFVFLLAITALSCQKKKETSKRKVSPEMLLEMNRKMVSAESEIIKKYIADNNLEMEKSQMGFYFKEVKPFTGDTIKTGDFVTLAYTTSLLDGTICYSSATSGLMNFTVGKAQVESGLEQAIQQMGQGSIVKLILPPYLAHGIAGDGNKIPKLSILIMDVEVVKIDRAISAQ